MPPTDPAQLRFGYVMRKRTRWRLRRRKLPLWLLTTLRARAELSYAVLRARAELSYAVHRTRLLLSLMALCVRLLAQLRARLFLSVMVLFIRLLLKSLHVKALLQVSAQ